MLIIEGSDLTGKTTLCRELVQRICDAEVPVMYGHFGRLPKNWDYFWGYMPHMIHRMVRDRFYMSEVCYGAKCRGFSNVDPETYRLLDAYARTMGAVTVVLTANPLLLEAKYKETQTPETFDLDKVLSVNGLFSEIAHRKNLTFGHETWKMDVDFTHHINDEEDWISDRKIEQIVELWLKRHHQLKQLTDRREED